MASGTYPFAPFEWMIAMRYLRPRRKQAFVTVIAGFSLLGIGLGVAALIIVMSVMNGFRAELLGRILGLNGHMVVQSLEGGIEGYDAVASRIRAVPGVVSATPIVEGDLIVTANNVTTGARVRGIRKPDLAALMENFRKVNRADPAGGGDRDPLSPAALENFDGSDSVLIGVRMASKLGLMPGRPITLIAPKGQVTPFGMTPRIKTYRVAGLFKLGMSEYDQTFIFMPLQEAQLFFGTGGTASGIEIMVDDPDRVAQYRDAVSAAAGPRVQALDWQDISSSFFGALVVERNVMFLILMIIVLVAAFNIISGLIMMVKDKSGDIAILRTMGATRGAIMRVFFIAGATIGVSGTVMGFVLGLLFCENIESIRQAISQLTGAQLFDPTIYFLSEMPAKIDPGEVTLVVFISLALSFLATLYPSWRAARLDPVEALRYE